MKCLTRSLDLGCLLEIARNSGGGSDPPPSCPSGGGLPPLPPRGCLLELARNSGGDLFRTCSKFKFAKTICIFLNMFDEISDSLEIRSGVLARNCSKFRWGIRPPTFLSFGWGIAPSPPPRGCLLELARNPNVGLFRTCSKFKSSQNKLFL